MRIRVLFPLCVTGLLACATAPRSTDAASAAVGDSTPVQPCPTPPPGNPGDVFITANAEGKVHFSTTTVQVQAGQTVTFVSQVQQDRCIGVAGESLFKEGSQNPLLVPACQSASWTLRGKDPQGNHKLWSCPMSDCSKCTEPQGITETINGTLEVTGRGED
ncbi:MULTISPECIES: hypothetical protein [Corallococcus]|uniref:hypothetical protein n=1 Tax=Corallococcus TaxID=83461 RepID=UPI0011C3782A|nr:MULTISPECIES: hypothetical protein [Corallococcus]